MALYRRNGIYHTDFTVNGQRVRQTLETTDKREAIQQERDLIARAKEGKLSAGVTAEFSRSMFSQAVDRFLSERGLRVLPETVGQERSHFAAMRDLFAGKRLNQISADDIRQFQARRVGEGKHPNTVNHEVKALLRLLKRAKLLSRVRDDVKLLQVKREPRQMLTPAEKQHLFATAASNPDWQTAYCAGLLTANTTMRPCEIKRLLWRDVDPFERIVTVRRSKTEAGTRRIPLNDEGYSAIAALKQRSDALGTYAPEFYVLHRQFPKPDPTRPMGKSGWRSAWRSLRSAVECPKCGKLQPPADVCQDSECKAEMKNIKSPHANLRYYDLRHQSVTEMLEGGVPEGVIREIAGHLDPAMTRLYSHPRLAARRAAVEALQTLKAPAETALPEGGYVTSHVTKALPEAIVAS